MDSSKKKMTIQIVLVTLLCVVCFLAGISVPALLNSTKGINSKDKEKFESIQSLLKNDWYYANDVENLDELLWEQAIMGMTNLEKDVHTNYFNLEQAKRFSESLQGSSVGIGVNYYVDSVGNLVVKQVFINSTADKNGLLPGDVITQVDDKVCKDTKTDDILTYIQNHHGKSIQLKYQRNNEEKSVHVTPSEYDNTVICNIYDGYGEIILTSFSEHSGKDVASAMARLQKEGIKKMILDLRDNSGGYLSATVDIASTFLPSDSIVFKEKKKDGSIQETKTTSSYTQIPMDKIVVLQNQETASASEALIGALKDNLGDIVTTIGETSYGKGTEQVSVPFSDGTSIKYTIAEWITPKETSINLKGFTPDIQVEPELIRSVKYASFDKEDTITVDTVASNAKALQVFLQFLGYEVDRTDEYFSPTSSQGLRSFQEDNGLSVTGNCDKETWDTLLEKTVYKLNENSLETDIQRTKALEIIQ